MSNIVEADFKVVHERTLPVIASEILLIEQHVGQVALDGAIRIGRRLQEAKEKVEHGQWEDWCRENLNYSKSKTEKLMKIAAEYGDENSPYAKAYMCTDLSISKALRLLQIPEDEVEEFADGHDIEGMTVKDLEAEIQKMKDAAISLEVKNDNLNLENEELKNQIQGLKEKGADPAEITRLEEKLEKQTSKAKMLQEKLKLGKAEKDQAVKKAVEAEREALKKAAKKEVADQLSAVEAKKAELAGKVAALERKVENASNEATLIFKLRVDQLQEVFSNCQAAASACEDPERLRQALRKVLENMIKALK